MNIKNNERNEFLANLEKNNSLFNNSKQENRIRAIQIALASPETIRSWSKGEVTKSETINYKSLKPEEGGLFDESIFGPIKNYECSCGRYKKVKFRGKKCEKCKVEITECIVRRERMGHIDLACPVAHMWMIKELPLPSKISLILGMTYKEVEEIVYFVNYIVLDAGFSKDKIFNEREVIHLSDSKNSKQSRAKLRKQLRLISEEILAIEPKGKDSFNYKMAIDFYKRLDDSNLPFSISDVFNFINKYTGVKFGIGAEAIYELLQKIDLTKLENQLRQELSSEESINFADAKVKKTLRRLQVVSWLKNSGNKPEWMILKVIPVIPPDLRPIIQLEGGRFTTSDINTFYRRIIIRNDRLKRILQLNAASIIANNEKRMLQEAVDSLIDNSARKKPVTSKDKHPLKSLTDHLKGKQGLFRQNLLGKRVDYSGRSVIVIGPDLKMYEVGFPIIMALKLFKPFIIRELIRKTDDNGLEIKPIVNSIKAAEKVILEQDDVIWPILHKVIKERPLLLNRAPTLHRLGIQAFEPKLVEGKAIRLHPLVTPAFNADFDGDQMAIHTPITPEAVHEARSILLAPWHILGPKDGKPVITPTQDMVLGIFYLTNENKKAKGTGTLFTSIDEALNAYNLKKVDLHAIIGIDTNVYPKKQFKHQEGILITTIGKIILNNIFPSDFQYINEQLPVCLNENDVLGPNENVREYIAQRKEIKAFNKSILAKLIDHIYRNYDIKAIPEILDNIKDLGFEFSMRSSTTMSVFDVPIYTDKYTFIEEADQKVKEQKNFYQKGLLTNNERYKKVIEIWNQVKDKVSEGIKVLINKPEHRDNSIMIMAESGARGNISNFTQLCGMRGLMSKSYNYDQKSKSSVIHDIIEAPIKHSFIEGLTVTEYFNSSYGARKGMTDTAMKTSKSGYMTRKLVDATQEVIVKSLDCQTYRGVVVEDIIDTRLNTIIETIAERMAGRYVNQNVYHPKTKELILENQQLITPEIAEQIVNAKITQVEVRSPLMCQQHQGICQKCFGIDLTTKEPITVGTVIGVIAAQSIGEPGTQLTMRTFHSGGVAGEANVAQGFERLKQIFDVVAPKGLERAQIAEINGYVTEIDTKDDNKNVPGKDITKVVTVKNEIDERTYEVDINATLRVKVGDLVTFGDKITEGSIELKELLTIAGINVVRQYMLKEVQKIYRLQGIEISDKYVEIIIRQLTNKVQIQNPNDSRWTIHEIVDINIFQDECTKLLINNKTPATAANMIFGLEEPFSKNGSFLSSASFQDTKKILTDAAVKGQIDFLNDLKENVIMGNLIPAGTGLKSSEEVIEESKAAGRFNY